MEYNVYRLAEMDKAVAEIQNNPDPAQSTVTIHGVENLHAARDMLRRAELLQGTYGAHVNSIDSLRILARTDTLVSDIMLYLVPALGAAPDLRSEDARLVRLMSYVDAIEHLSYGVHTYGVFPFFVRNFTRNVSNSIEDLFFRILSGPQLIIQLQQALLDFYDRAENAYIPLP